MQNRSRAKFLKQYYDVGINMNGMSPVRRICENNSEPTVTKVHAFLMHLAISFSVLNAYAEKRKGAKCIIRNFLLYVLVILRWLHAQEKILKYIRVAV